LRLLRRDVAGPADSGHIVSIVPTAESGVAVRGAGLAHHGGRHRVPALPRRPLDGPESVRIRLYVSRARLSLRRSRPRGLLCQFRANLSPGGTSGAGCALAGTEGESEILRKDAAPGVHRSWSPLRRDGSDRRPAAFSQPRAWLAARLRVL